MIWKKEIITMCNNIANPAIFQVILCISGVLWYTFPLQRMLWNGLCLLLCLVWYRNNNNKTNETKLRFSGTKQLFTNHTPSKVWAWIPSHTVLFWSPNCFSLASKASSTSSSPSCFVVLRTSRLLVKRYDQSPVSPFSSHQDKSLLTAQVGCDLALEPQPGFNFWSFCRSYENLWKSKPMSSGPAQSPNFCP